MNPSLPLPTDNIYKFSCLFGLALIISSLFAFITAYSSLLDRKVKYAEIVIPLEAKTARTKAEDDVLAMNKKLIEVMETNEKAANRAVGAALGIGLTLSLLGAARWYIKIQTRDDRLADLQIQKLEAEIAKLKAETPPLPLTEDKQSSADTQAETERPVTV